MSIPIPMVQNHANPVFLKALNAKAIPVKNVRKHQAEYTRKRKTFGRMIAVYCVAFLAAFLSTQMVPGISAAVVFFLVTLLGVIVMTPVITTFCACSDILSAIKRNYLDL